MENDNQEMMQMEAQKGQLQQQQQQISAQVRAIQQALQQVEQKEQEFWAEYKKTIDTARYDFVIDETMSSPTYRNSSLQLLLQGAQYNVPIPPEAIIELMEIPKSTKEKMLKMVEEQKQMQAQMAQQQQKSAQMKNANRVADASSKSQ